MNRGGVSNFSIWGWRRLHKRSLARDVMFSSSGDRSFSPWFRIACWRILALRCVCIIWGLNSAWEKSVRWPCSSAMHNRHGRWTSREVFIRIQPWQRKDFTTIIQQTWGLYNNQFIMLILQFNVSHLWERGPRSDTLLDCLDRSNVGPWDPPCSLDMVEGKPQNSLVGGLVSPR